MKNLLAAIALLCATQVFAGSYTITTTTTQDAKLARAVTRANKLTCVKFGLAATCSQSQARDAFCQRKAGTNAPCTGSNTVNIYSTVQAFLDAETTRLIRDQWGPQSDADLDRAYIDAAAKGTQAQKDAACVAVGLAAGCLP